MTWTTPKTWVTGEALTASDLNTHLKDNLNALKTPPTDHYECDEAANYTTSATSFVDVDAINLALTLTTTGGDVLVGFTGAVSNAGGVLTHWNMSLDGVDVAANDGIAISVGAALTQVGFAYLLTGLDAGAHTVKLRWKVSANTSTLYAGAGTATADLHPQFWAREV